MLVIDDGKTLAEQELLVLMSALAIPDLLHIADEPLAVRELSCRADASLSTAYREVK